MDKEAYFYNRLKRHTVKCVLCPHFCEIKNNDFGFCQVRQNKKGVLYSAIYGKYIACSLDPIEKKPLYHFYPGKLILSLGTRGCNFKCPYCQNWHISQIDDAVVYEITSQEAVTIAQEQMSFGVAYTYNEPAIWYEFVYDTAKDVHEFGFKNVLVTNGYINEQPLEKLLPFIDALNIDIKSMDNDFYIKYCKGTLDPVLQSAVLAKKHVHVEITNLVITSLNDEDRHFHELGKWVKENLGKDTPIHISRYFPMYEMKNSATSVETLKRAKQILCDYVDFVYIGNVQDVDDNTYCPSCKEIIIQRKGYFLEQRNDKDGKCPLCGIDVNIVG